MPILCETQAYKEKVLHHLNANRVYPREYFKPSLETIFSDNINCPIALDITQRVLCLPMSDYLTEDQVSYICNLINKI